MNGKGPACLAGRQACRQAGNWRQEASECREWLLRAKNSPHPLSRELAMRLARQHFNNARALCPYRRNWVPEIVRWAVLYSTD